MTEVISADNLRPMDTTYTLYFRPRNVAARQWLQAQAATGLQGWTLAKARELARELDQWLELFRADGSLARRVYPDYRRYRLDLCATTAAAQAWRAEVGDQDLAAWTLEEALDLAAELEQPVVLQRDGETTYFVYPNGHWFSPADLDAGPSLLAFEPHGEAASRWCAAAAAEDFSGWSLPAALDFARIYAQPLKLVRPDDSVVYWVHPEGRWRAA